MPELAVIDNTMTTQTGDDVIARVRAEIERRGITQAQAAREIGISPTTLTQLLGGTYAADPTRQIERLAKWLGLQEEARAQAKLPPAPAWVNTPIAERVLAALGYAQMAGDVAVIYGVAGVGKSTAAREYARRYPNVWIATMSPATAGVSTALEEICLALGFRDLPQGAARMSRAIIARIAGAGGLIVVDEAQHLTVSALDAIRAIHDATGVGLALIGNEFVYARMTGGYRAAYLDRLFSRIGKRVRLARAGREDVERIASAFGLRNGAVKLLVEIGARAGALRAVVKTLRLASMMAAGSGIEPQHIEAAWRDLEGV
jgi:DNA transposition AAA+ family ATPase